MGAWQERGGWCFLGGFDTQMHTMDKVYRELCIEKFCLTVPRFGHEAVDHRPPPPPPPIKMNNDVAFVTGSFLITNSFNIDVSSNKRLALLTYYLLWVIMFSIFKIYKCFYLLQGEFEV